MESDRSTRQLVTAPPAELGLCPQRWDQVLQLAGELTSRNHLPAVSLQVQRYGLTTGVHSFGTRCLNRSIPIDEQTLFLVASLTKPMVAMAVLRLVEQGALGLNQRVGEFLPNWNDPAKRLMTLRHLLTHTSGLPDMLPDNLPLRQNRADLNAFVSGTVQVPLNNPVGRAAQYQSMGFALLGEIIQVVSGQSCAEFLRQELFLPLGMTRTWLGLPESMRSEQNIAEIRVPAEQQTGLEWNWNSPYWRELGAPWGGVLSTTSDVSRFLAAMLGTIPFFSPASIAEATGNRLDDFPLIPEQERRTRPWGLGWRGNWKDHRSSLCELLPATVCGHWGATGSLFWLDSTTGLGLVLLSSEPVLEKDSPLSRLSNGVAAALIRSS